MTKACLFAGLLRLITGVKCSTPPVEEHQPCLYFANHSSHFDFLSIWAALPTQHRQNTRPVAAQDYWGKGKIRRLIAQRLFRAILISRRGRGPNGEHPLAPIIEALRDGHSIIIFPEGTRSLDGQLQPFKAGLHELASNFPELPLVPVSLDNLNRILPKGESLPIPLIGKVTFASPVHLTKGESKADFLTRMHATLNELLNHES